MPRAGQHSAAPFAHTAWNSFILCVISINAQRQDANGERVGDVNFCVIVLESPLKNAAGYPLCFSSRARTGSGWCNRPAGRNASKPSSAATATNRTGMTPTPSARRSPACRAFTIAADASTACPAERLCFIRTKYTMARRAPRRVSLPHGLYRTGADPEDTRRQATAVYSLAACRRIRACGAPRCRY